MAQKPKRKKTKPKTNKKQGNLWISFAIIFAGLVVLCVIIISAIFFAISVVNKDITSTTNSANPSVQMQRFSIASTNQINEVFSNSIYDKNKQITGISLDSQIKIRDELPRILIAADGKTIQEIDIALNVYPDSNQTTIYPAKFIYTKETQTFEFLLGTTLVDSSTSIELKKNALTLTLKHIFNTIHTINVSTFLPSIDPYLLEIVLVDDTLNQDTINTITSLSQSKKTTLKDMLILSQGAKIQGDTINPKSNIVVYQLKTNSTSQALPIICLLDGFTPVVSSSSSSEEVDAITNTITPEELMTDFVSALKEGAVTTIKTLLSFDETGNFSDLKTIKFNDISFKLAMDTPSIKTYDLTMDILTSDSSVFTKGKSEWIVTINYTASTQTSTITGIEKKSNETQEKDPLLSFVSTIVSFGVTNFNTTSEIPKDILADLCMAFIQADSELETWDFTVEQVKQTAETYFGVANFDGTDLASYDKISGTYFILGRGLTAYEHELLEKKWDDTTQTYTLKIKFSPINMANTTNTLFIDSVVRKNNDDTYTIINMNS
ncbi:MAG: hypothetical protein RSB96_02865 [Oscillospiraceae bacterium]